MLHYGRYFKVGKVGRVSILRKSVNYNGKKFYNTDRPLLRFYANLGAKCFKKFYDIDTS
jgi:hypothetical protein